MKKKKSVQEIFEQINIDIESGRKHRSLSGYAPKNLTEKIKMGICRSIVGWSIEADLSNKEVAKILGMTEPQTSRLLAYHIDYFSLEFLIEKVEILSVKNSNFEETVEKLKRVA